MRLHRSFHYVSRLSLSFFSIYVIGIILGPEIAAAVFRNGIGWEVGDPPINLSLEPFETRASDDVQISGWYRRSAPEAPVVIFVHGIFGDRRQMLGRANGLYDRNLNLVFFDLRGHGQSTSAPRAFGVSENRDVRAVVTWTRNQFPGSKIALFGYSLGGAAILLGDGPPDVDALVLEATFTTLAATLHNRIQLMVPLFPDYVESRLVELVSAKIGIRADDISPLRAVSSTTIPTMVIGGENDPYVLKSESYELYRACRARTKTVYIAPEAGHRSISLKNEDAYQGSILSFLERTLGSFGDFRSDIM